MLDRLVKNATDCDLSALADNAQIAQFLLDEMRLYNNPSSRRDGSAIALSWFFSGTRWCNVVISGDEIRISSVCGKDTAGGVYYNTMGAADALDKILSQIGAS